MHDICRLRSASLPVLSGVVLGLCLAQYCKEILLESDPFMSSVLFKPYRFRSGVVAKNRAILTPLTNKQSPSTMLSVDEFNWLRARMDGGFGVLATCASHVVKEAQAWDGELGVFSSARTHGLSKSAQAAAETDSLLFTKLFHGGFRSPRRINGMQPVSGSSFVLDAPDFEQSKAAHRAWNFIQRTDISLLNF